CKSLFLSALCRFISWTPLTPPSPRWSPNGVHCQQTMSRDTRPKRDRHALNAEGMVLCNPRDKEAAHRAQMEGIATDDPAAVTWRKCRSLLHKWKKTRKERR